MILVNALIKSCPDLYQRIHIREQFNVGGIQSRVFPKLEELDYHLLNIQIDAFKVAAENDIEDAFGDELSLYSDISQPAELLDILIESLADTPQALEQLSCMLRNLLLIRGETDTRIHVLKTINSIVNRIAVDFRSGNLALDDYRSLYGVSVGGLVQKFTDLDRSRHSLDSASSSSHDRLLAERNELERELWELKRRLSNPTFTSQNNEKRKVLCKPQQGDCKT